MERMPIRRHYQICDLNGHRCAALLAIASGIWTLTSIPSASLAFCWICVSPAFGICVSPVFGICACLAFGIGASLAFGIFAYLVFLTCAWQAFWSGSSTCCVTYSYKAKSGEIFTKIYWYIRLIKSYYSKYTLKAFRNGRRKTVWRT